MSNDCPYCHETRPHQHTITNEGQLGMSMLPDSKMTVRVPVQVWERYRAVVRALAVVPVKDLPGANIDTMCHLCDTWFVGRVKAAEPANHAESCPWRLARELIGDSE